VHLLEKKLRELAAEVHHPRGSAEAALTARFLAAVELIDLLHKMNANKKSAQPRPEEEFGTPALRHTLKLYQKMYDKAVDNEEKRLAAAFFIDSQSRPDISTAMTADQWGSAYTQGAGPADTNGLYAAACFERRQASIIYAVFVWGGRCCASHCRHLVDPWCTDAFKPALFEAFAMNCNIAYLVDLPFDYSNQQVVDALVTSCLVHHSQQCMDFRARNSRPFFPAN
jgi:hypothetical protein